jgi:hypothetical protein
MLVLLHKGNNKPLIPIARTTSMKDIYKSMTLILNAIMVNLAITGNYETTFCHHTYARVASGIYIMLLYCSFNYYSSTEVYYQR